MDDARMIIAKDVDVDLRNEYLSKADGILTAAGMSIFNAAIDRARCVVMRSPTIDAVPVVRCRECAHWNREWEPKSSGPGTHFCPMLGINSASDFYCKNGLLDAVACVEDHIQQEVMG